MAAPNVVVINSHKEGQEGFFYLVSGDLQNPRAFLIQEGCGDNLLDEDIEAGYVDYLNWYEGRFSEREFNETGDGGMIMYKHMIAEKPGCLLACIGDVLDDIGISGGVVYVV